ncbi:hypothetical protein ACGF0J_28835 [Nonomuraea sp. NPDC047897]|uniref:hypothetical protein n=1 Tax=Nonomuraea sp. NPDC047897 TaxID=3364346 RepID=UPI003716979D
MAIKRVDEHVEIRSLGNVVLYREDLQGIARLMGELGGLEIRCAGFAATGPGDFDELPERLGEVCMSAGQGSAARLDVRLDRGAAALVLTEPDTRSYGIAFRIDEICAARRRGRFGWPFRQDGAHLINAYRRDRPSFFQRTRDDWITGSVMAAVGGVIGYFVNEIT